MFKKIKALLLVSAFTVSTTALAVIPWQVVDTYIETVKTFSTTTSAGNVSTVNETSTEQYKDADGNTVEKTTVKTFEITEKNIPGPLAC